MSLSFLTFQPLIPNHNSYDRLSNQTLHETGARDDVQPRCDATRRAAAPPPLDSAMPGPMQGIGTGLLHASPETVDSEAGRHHLPLPRSSLTRQGLLGSRRFHRFSQILYDWQKPKSTLVFFVAVRTHKNQDNPLAVDANVSYEPLINMFEFHSCNFPNIPHREEPDIRPVNYDRSIHFFIPYVIQC